MDNPTPEPPVPSDPNLGPLASDPWRRTLHLLLEMGRDLRGQDPARAIDCFRQAGDLAKSLNHPREEAQALILVGATELQRGSLTEAELSLERARELSRSGDLLEQANCLNQLGLLRLRQGRTEEGQICLRESLARTTEADMTGQAVAIRAVTLETMGTVYREKGEPDQALRYYNEALELRRAAGDETGIATDLSHLGSLHTRLGRHQEAVSYFRDALERHRTIGDRRSLVRTANNLAAALLSLGNLDEARALLLECRDSFQKLGENGNVASVLANLGLLEATQGRLDDATAHFRESLRICRELEDPAGQSYALNNMSMVANQSGRSDEAITLAEEALNLRRMLGHARGLAKPLLNLAQATLELGRIDDARRYAVEAREAAAKAASDEQRTEAQAVLAMIDTEAGRFEEAAQNGANALEGAERLADPKLIAACCHALGAAHLGRGSLEEAKQLLSKALRILRGWEHPYERARILHDEGRVLQRAGSIEAAAERLRRADAEFARLGNPRRRLRVLADLARTVEASDPVQAESMRALARELAKKENLESFWEQVLLAHARSDEAPDGTSSGLIAAFERLSSQLLSLSGTTAGPPPSAALRDCFLNFTRMATRSEAAAFDMETSGSLAEHEYLIDLGPAASTLGSLRLMRPAGALGGAELRALRSAASFVVLALVLSRERDSRAADVTSRAPVAAITGRNFQALIGGSSPMSDVYRLIEQVAPTESNVLVLGESGTGKELVARALHDLSARAGRAFVAINCPSIPRDLIESELFGHEKGAFTGAITTRQGKVELADGGTLFLDEVGDMALATQVKLLRFLQEREFERVGGSRVLRSDVRVLAATSRDLRASIQAGTFREDLYYRLNVVPIRVPPLRERTGDIPALVEHFLSLLGSREGRRPEISRGALDALCAADWPGNVRELRNTIEYMLTLAGDDVLEPPHLPAEVKAAVARGAIARARGDGSSRRRTTERGDELEGAAGSFLSDLRPGETLESRLMQLEAALIRAALDRGDWNQSAAARSLGVTETMVRNRMRQYGIRRAGEAAGAAGERGGER